ncbi:branched-chain amino acid ABC transporter permease [Halomarina salina]|uniref:Branched-chain amino acid ABC transporter permease n=1 Tax=Halomarina salina TaxID=1872699 RepID=A0ABD5RSH0_9EURY|nr:branched-chain amino acid ABC transporter permease [Halomarina salina]
MVDLPPIDDRRTFYGIIVVAALVLATGPVSLTPYGMKVVYFLFMYAALAYAWNFLSGYTGYGTFGPFAFIGLGAYATAVQVVYLNLAWPLALVGTTAFVAVFALVLGVILLRISGIYFAIATLLVAEGLRQGVLIETTYLKGSIGLNVAPLTNTEAYFAFMVLAFACLVLTYETATSRFGLRMLAVREDEQALSTIGVNPLRYKLSAFVVHGVLTGLAGSLYALSLGFLFPSTVFSISMTITLILLVVLGGIGTVWGPALGALILIPTQEILTQNVSDYHMLAFGVVLIVLILLMPEGLVNELQERGYLPRSRGV